MSCWCIETRRLHNASALIPLPYKWRQDLRDLVIFSAVGTLLQRKKATHWSKGHLAWIGLTHQQPAASSHPLLPFRLKDGAVEMHQKQWRLANLKLNSEIRNQGKEEHSSGWSPLQPDAALLSQPSPLSLLSPGPCHGHPHCRGLLKWNWSIIAFCSIFTWQLTKACYCTASLSGSLGSWSCLCIFTPFWLWNESLGFTVTMTPPLSYF